VRSLQFTRHIDLDIALLYRRLKLTCIFYVHASVSGINNKVCHFELLFNANEMRNWCTEHSIFQYTLNNKFVIIIIIIIVITFVQGIYTYIPETNYVPREYSVAAILLLLFMVLIALVSELNLLYFYISTFRSMCTVPNMAVFCISLTSFFPGMLLTYFLNDFEIVPVAPIITGITFVFTYYYYYYYYY